MEIARDQLYASGRPAVRHYRPGELGVRGVTHRTSVILTPTEVIDDWPPRSAADITPAHLERLLALDPRPDVVLIGTGEKQVFPAHEVLAPLARAHIGIEIMDTRAACRTWNILLSDERRVAAALIL